MAPAGPTETARVPMRDGVRLAADVYLPHGSRRVPAVLARTPYGAQGNAVWFAAIGRLFAERGMAFVAQDTRGHHGSEGAPEPFAHEGRDGYDTCDWIVRQPWSNGTIAVFGESYVGYTAMAAAASGHPAIRAAALRATSTDIAGDWLRHQGVLRLEFVIRWALAAWSGPDVIAPDLDWGVRPLSGVVRAAAPDRVPSVLDAWARGTGPARLWPGDAGWPSLVRGIRVPAHFTAGWWDLFIRGELRDWAHHARHAGHESLLHVEATDHAGHDWGDGPTRDPLADFEVLAARLPFILDAELDFLARHLLGAAGPARVRPVTWSLTHAGPRGAAAWPPPDARPLTLHLTDGGRANRGPEGGGLSVRADTIPLDVGWTHDPRDPVASPEGDAVGGWFHRPDERLSQVRDDVLTFTAEPRPVALDLAGPVTAELTLCAPAVGGHVMAKLSDVGPAGEAHRIADGACRLGDGESRVTVDLGHTGYRVRPGHRLRLEIAASAFPRYLLHPGTAEDPWDAIHLRPQPMRLRTGGGRSTLTVRVLPAEPDELPAPSSTPARRPAART